MATHYNITGYQGDYIYLILTGKDDSNNIIRLDGYDVRGQVRASYGSTGVLLDLNPTILGNGTGGAMIISIDSNISKDIPVSDHVYDIERYPIGVTSGNSVKLMQGKFTILPEITR
jgi:hypothetical protein